MLPVLEKRVIHIFSFTVTDSLESKWEENTSNSIVLSFSKIFFRVSWIEMFSGTREREREIVDREMGGRTK